jgi:hypothetical protein
MICFYLAGLASEERRGTAGPSGPACPTGRVEKVALNYEARTHADAVACRFTPRFTTWKTSPPGAIRAVRGIAHLSAKYPFCRYRTRPAFRAFESFS